MKLIALLFLINSSLAVANVLRFDCHNKIYKTAFGMIVIEEQGALKSYLFGTGISGQSMVSSERLSVKSALRVNGISQIVSHLKMTPADLAKISSVEVFTTGNFDDDAAGVRGANFYSKNSLIVKKGMFFGWAGAQKCL